jgi:hypothetical protein
MPNDETIKPDEGEVRRYHYNMDVMVPKSSDHPDELVKRRCAGQGFDGIRVYNNDTNKIDIYTEEELNQWNPNTPETNV